MGTERHWKCDDPVHRAAYAAITSEALGCLDGKWKILILCQLFALGTLRFSELERSVEGITQKMLVQQLRELEKDGIVARTAFPQVPPRVEYSLTDVGRALGPPMTALIDWAEMRRNSQAAGAALAR